MLLIGLISARPKKHPSRKFLINLASKSARAIRYQLDELGVR